VDGDLALAYSETLDDLVVSTIETDVTAFASGENLLEAILAAAGTIEDAGYTPGILVASPADLRALALLRQPSTDDYVGSQMDSLLASLRKVASKNVTAPLVLDRDAIGVLYLSPTMFATFEENHGTTNTSTIRIESNAAWNTERPDAAAKAVVAGS
jgi:hypothetical protein